MISSESAHPYALIPIMEMLNPEILLSVKMKTEKLFIGLSFPRLMIAENITVSEEMLLVSLVGMNWGVRQSGIMRLYGPDILNKKNGVS